MSKALLHHVSYFIVKEEGKVERRSSLGTYLIFIGNALNDPFISAEWKILQKLFKLQLNIFQNMYNHKAKMLGIFCISSIKLYLEKGLFSLLLIFHNKDLILHMHHLNSHLPACLHVETFLKHLHAWRKEIGLGLDFILITVRWLQVAQWYFCDTEHVRSF